MGSRPTKRTLEMNTLSSLRNQVAAAFSALALSLVLITGTVAVPTDSAIAADTIVIGQLA